MKSGECTWLQAFEEFGRWISPIGMSPRRVDRPYVYHGVEFEPDIKIELEDEHFVDISNADEIRDLDLNPIKKPRKKKAKGLDKQKQESIVQEQVLCEICPILDLTTSALQIRSHKHKNTPA